MTPHYTDDWLTIYGGDCREVLSSLPSDSVDCVVTSPPYWGLRDYGTATWVGGDEGCDHKGKPIPTSAGFNERYFGRPSSDGNKQDDMRREVFRESCGKCGATRVDSQLGLERTPEEYVANMVAVFREVRRVLKPSGTCWLNLGDSYAGGEIAPPGTAKQASNRGPTAAVGVSKAGAGLRTKNLVGIPWRVAFALQADGWYLRSDIIWSKPNPMPESVTDRPTKSHEYLFLLTKSARYYFDADAVREANDAKRLPYGGQNKDAKHVEAQGNNHGPRSMHRPMSHERAIELRTSGRNIRSVWNIATRPYPGAHFAVFPPELPERCIKAGSSERGVCPECGAPWERVTLKTTRFEGGSGKAGRTAEDANANGKWAGIQYGTNIKLGPVVDVETIGWEPTCEHGKDPAGLNLTGSAPSVPRSVNPLPAVILDPFAGSGTVGMVANRLSRRAILIDLNPDYLKQQMTRNAQTPLGLGA